MSTKWFILLQTFQHRYSKSNKNADRCTNKREKHLINFESNAWDLKKAKPNRIGPKANSREWVINQCGDKTVAVRIYSLCISSALALNCSQLSLQTSHIPIQMLQLPTQFEKVKVNFCIFYPRLFFSFPSLKQGFRYRFAYAMSFIFKHTRYRTFAGRCHCPVQAAQQLEGDYHRQNEILLHVADCYLYKYLIYLSFQSLPYTFTLKIP